MSTTLSYGRVRPSNGDNGSTFWDQLANNITLDDGHTHNGSNSSLLASTSITPTSATISSAGWAATSGGRYRQSVTTPAGITFGSYGIELRDSSGVKVNLGIEKITNTTYYVYSIDNTLTLTAIYLV